MFLWNTRFAVLILVLSQALLVRADSSVIWATEEWKGFTDMDGSGIYNRVVNRAFANQNWSVRQEYMPFARSLHHLEVGKADFAGGVAESVAAQKGFISARYPIAVTRIQALFHRRYLEQWEGKESLMGQMVAASSYQPELIGLDSRNPLVEIVDNRVQAMNMLVKGRVRFFVEDEFVLKTVMSSFSFNRDDYVIRTVGYSAYYMVSPDTEKGRKVMSSYNRGITQLHHSGELEPFYRQAEMIYPLAPDVTTP